MNDAEFLEDVADVLQEFGMPQKARKVLQIADDLRHSKTGGTPAHVRQKSEELARTRMEVRRLQGLLKDSRIRLVAVIEKITKETGIVRYR